MAGRPSEDLHTYPADVDDYRLVFLSSDSSEEKEEEDDDVSSNASTKCSVILDECDWDYFEQNVPTTAAATTRRIFSTNSPFESPFFDRKSFLSSPHFYRREMSDSPQSLQRLISLRESDIGTDEEMLSTIESSSSQTSSEGFLSDNLRAWEKNHNKCATKTHSCKCSSTPQYVAIPVPILIPMESLHNWNNVNSPDLLQLINSSNNLLYQHQGNIVVNSNHDNNSTCDVTKSSSSPSMQNQQVRYRQQQQQRRVVERNDENIEKEEREIKVLPGLNGDDDDDDDEGKNRERKRHEKIGNVSIPCSIIDNSGNINSCNLSALPLRREKIVVSSDSDEDYEKGGHMLSHKGGGALSKIRKCSNENDTFGSSGKNNNAAHLSETIKITSQHETHTCDYLASCCFECKSEPYSEHNNLIKTGISSSSSNALQSTSSSLNCGAMISVGKLKEQSENDDGYLLSESVFVSSSDETENENEEAQLKPVQRSYDVAGAASLPAENIASDVESSSSSSSSNDSGSIVELSDSEDTGIDDRRTKAKKFSKVFVVNKHSRYSETDDDDGRDSCSSANRIETSTSEEEETSDNDTDTDGVTLHYMKPFVDDCHEDTTTQEIVVLKAMRHIDSDEDNDGQGSENVVVVLNSIKSIDNDNDFIECAHIDEKKAKVNGASENVVIDDKNNHHSPSSALSEYTNQVIDEIVSTSNAIVTNNSPDGDRQMDVVVADEALDNNNESKKIQSCNLSMIFGSPCGGGNKRERVQTDDDVKTSSSLDENLLKIESPLNSSILHEQQHMQRQDQHDTTESDSQTSVEIVNNDNVPIITTLTETGFDQQPKHSYTHVRSTDVACSNDDLQNFSTTSAPGSNNKNNTILQNNSCVKQMNVNEATTSATMEALQELPSTENASVLSQLYSGADGSAASCSNNNKFTSLIMITQTENCNNTMMMNSSVNVISNDTTQIINTDSRDAIIVQHKNWQPRESSSSSGSNNGSNASGVKSKIGFYEKNINKVKENLNSKVKGAPEKSKVHENLDKNNIIDDDDDDDDNFEEIEKEIDRLQEKEEREAVEDERAPSEKSIKSNKSDDVKVITGQNTLTAVVCLEDGLADDDSWVEELSQNDEEEFVSTETGSDFDSSDEMSLSLGVDREEELRGYNRVSIDFTLHTIVEESCEESEYESSDRRSQRISASELEKYFFFGLSGDVNQAVNVASSNKEHDESPSETSSVCSEGMDSLNTPENEVNESGTLISSRLEKYFLSGFMGFQNDGAGNESDGSGSVGSDSEGRPSPEQRRKKLVRARGSGRSHSSSLDNLLAKEESLENQNETQLPTQAQTQPKESDDSSETTDTCDDNHAEKTENHCDTVKRKKKNKKHDSMDEVVASKKNHPEVEIKNPSDASETEDDENGRKTPQPEFLMPSNNNLVQSRKQHSRDSGFIGSNDDLLKSEGQKSPELKIELAEIQEDLKESEQSPIPENATSQQFTNLMRKDSFNAWSSDEETNLMMSKMRQFFKSLVAANGSNKSSTTPTVVDNGAPKPAPRQRQRPPQLVYFENELARLMKTVPGVTESQVKELVEYLSSEDTWSDSYDSSDYTSSDKESAGKSKSIKIQQQISASCQEIIQKFDTKGIIKHDEEGDMGDGGVLEDGINKETAFVYQKLVASISKIADEKPPHDITNSPPIIAKVMHHIGTRLVALMHEVSSGESLKSNSPRQPRHRRVQAKISATTTEDDDSTSESNMEESALNNLPRSKSHDLLLDGGKQPSSHDHMTAEEREASDYERYSWRGSFESALLTSCDSRNKLSTLENSTSALSILAAKRRSAGDLLFTPNNLSREQLDRVRSCGSIGGDHDLENSKLWESTQSQESSRKRVPGILEDDTDESSDNDQQRQRSTLPRSLQTITASTTNSLPRLPTSSSTSSSSSTSGVIQKFLHNNVKSARYRAPGFTRTQQTPKRALSAPGLQPFLARRDRRSKVQSHSMGKWHHQNSTATDFFLSRSCLRQ